MLIIHWLFFSGYPAEHLATLQAQNSVRAARRLSREHRCGHCSISPTATEGSWGRSAVGLCWEGRKDSSSMVQPRAQAYISKSLHKFFLFLNLATKKLSSPAMWKISELVTLMCWWQIGF